MFRLYLSERSIQLLNTCIETAKSLEFDAINSPILLSVLMFEKSTYLYQYLIDQGVKDDIEIEQAVGWYITERQINLRGKTTEGETTKDEKIKDNLQSEHDEDVSFYNKKGKILRYPVADETLNVFETMSNICQESNFECVEPIHMICAMFESNDQTLKKLFEDFDISYREAKNYYADRTIFKNEIIPYELSGFMSCLNNKVDTKKPCEILMRDKEVEQIWNISLKKNKRNTIIVGEAGVGKSALIEKMTYEIVKGTCPERFKDFFVISLDVNSLIAGTTFRGQAEERIKQLIEFLEKNDNVILFIDEVHTILGAGSCFEGEMDLANAMKPILARGDTIVIGATTNHEYEAYFATDAALSRRFEKVVVEEPVAKDIYPMIKNKVNSLAKYHGVKISKAMVEYTILIANCFAFEKKNPDKTLDLIDRSMVTAYRKGKPQVDKESILANFGIYFELFNGMSEDSRKEVAYHEVGHYIVGKFSGKLVDYNWLAISIMPAEDYLGVTCSEIRHDKIPFTNSEYYVDLIAYYLGGRVGENVFRNDFTSGAGQDLNIATKLAFEVVSKYGMSAKKDEKNNIFLNTPSYPMLTEKSTNFVNEEVQNLIKIAYERAEDIINENKELLEMIVKKLLEKQIMSEIELDRIWQQYFKKKKKKA